MEINEEQLKKFILDSGLVSKKDMTEASRKAVEKNQTIGNILLSEGKIKEGDLKRMEAFLLGIPFVSLKDKNIDFSILSLIPEPIARNHNILAYEKSGDSLLVAMLDIADLPSIDFIKKSSGLKILPRLTDAESIKHELIRYRKNLHHGLDSLIKRESQSIQVDKGGNNLVSSPEIVGSLISHAIAQNASDIHIEPREKDLGIRYRIDGTLHDAMTFDKSAGAGITARIKALAHLAMGENRLPQEGRFKIDQNGEKISFRIFTLPTFYGEKIVLRILRENTRGFSLEALGFHGEGLERMHASLKVKTGMVLASGPSHSGKTTTLYTMLEILNTPEVNISTIEDPIEYQIPRVNQTQTKPEIGLTFASGLRSLLKQDPDVVMVGEIQDRETALLAVNASIAGGLVLSSIPANSSSRALLGLVEMGLDPFLVVSAVKFVISERLVRKLLPSNEKYILSQTEKARLARIIDLDRMLRLLKKEHIIGENDTWETIPFFRPGRSAESEDGYSGRTGVHEVMRVTDTIKELVIKGGSQHQIEMQAKKEGMLTMIEDGVYQAVLGITTLEEVFKMAGE